MTLETCLPQAATAPLVALRRGALIESVHFGAIAVADAHGALVAHAGDACLVTYLRSTAKPFQLLPLVESGAADHFAFSDADLAVMAASHSGETAHVARVADILARIGLPVEALQCGAHPPYHDDTRQSMERSRTAPSALHNNCSGKHAGMLAWTVFHGAPIDSYLDEEHPLQQEIRRSLAQLGTVRTADVTCAIDGCSAPCFAMPLTAAATAFAQLAHAARPRPDPRMDARAAALRRIAGAMARHPELVAGSNRFDTELMRATGGKVLSKAGAEGYQGLALIDAGLGVAIKIADGQGRAAAPVAIAVLRQLNALSEDSADQLAAML